MEKREDYVNVVVFHLFNFITLNLEEIDFK